MTNVDGKARAKRALMATRVLGLQDEDVIPVLKDLWRLFDNNWEHIESESYRPLIDACFDSMEKQGVENKEKGVSERDSLTSKRPSKRPHLGVPEKDEVSSMVNRNRRKLVLEDDETSPESRQRSRDNDDDSVSVLPSAKLCSQAKKSHSTNCGVLRAANFRQPEDEPGFLNRRKESEVGIGESAPGSSNGRKKNKPSNHCKREMVIAKTDQSITEPLNVVFPLTVEESSLRVKPDSYKIGDISKGLEKFRISLVNEYGKEDLPKFTYMTQNTVYQSAYLNITLARISDEDCCSSCSGDCLAAPTPCACTHETQGEYAYTSQGLLKEEFLGACISMAQEPPNTKNFVFCRQDCPLQKTKGKCEGHLVRKFIKECWTKCGCDWKCGNRVVQRGVARKLQVFMTRGGKGWGVRSINNLPKGAFVCEYIGEILTNMELYERNMQSSGNERHTYPVTLDADWGSEKILRDEEALCLDATNSGNVARFINHRCDDANLIDVPVEVETPDHHYYHIAFFTTREISAYEELTWDYGIDFFDYGHPVKAFQCTCGSELCRGSTKKGDKSKSIMLR